LFIVLLASVPVSAATVNWNISGDGLWSESAKLSPVKVPDPGDDVFINNSGAGTITVSSDATVTTLRLGGAKKLILATGKLTLFSMRGWQVNAGNTGLAGVGLDKNTLPVYNGTNPIPTGSTISMKKLIDPDFVNGNITIDRCWIVLTGNPSNSIGSPNGINTVKDSDIEATHYQGSPVGTGGTNKAIIVLRCNISGGQGLAYMNGPGTI
jgi:hypothetical protein